MCFFNVACTSTSRLDGKTAVVTGANTGIGKCTVQDLYTRGARVIMACRDKAKATQAATEIKEACKALDDLGTVLVVRLDLADLKSVRECAGRLLESENRIDLLINNAGVMTCPEGRTRDGFETQIGTNHLGPFLFTMLLLPRICQSVPARIVNVSSVAHDNYRIDLDDLNWEKKPYDPLRSYRQSKLANVLFTKELARKLEERGVSGVTTYALHPGVVRTHLWRHLEDASWLMTLLLRVFSWSIKTPRQGAQTTLYCAVDEECAHQSGLYYAECAEKKPNESALNQEDARGLWDLSWRLVGLSEGYDPFSVQAKL